MRVFVSAVSKEFGVYRTPLDQGVSGLDVDVDIQEQMGGVSSGLILRLDEYVRRADLVLHLIGDRAGALADAAQTKLIMEAHPRLRDLFGPDIESEPVTYTQWEAYLALYHERQLVIAQADGEAPVERDQRHAQAPYSFGEAAERASQEAHVRRLKSVFSAYPAFTFKDVEDLELQFYRTEEWRRLLSAAGLVFAPDLSKLPQTFAETLLGRDAEMDRLSGYWRGDGANIAALDAMGGAGKTALAAHFATGLINGSEAVEKAEDVAAAYAWSFYSQGSNEDRQTSAEEFFVGAYKYFRLGQPPKEAGAKAEPLARAIQRQKTLLILDGLEPLQYAAGGRSGGGASDKGRVGGVKDPDIERLLDLLADKNPGLVLVTTRIALSRLEGKPTVRREELSPLDLMDGIALLRRLEVEPNHAEKPMPPLDAFPSAIAAELPDGYAAPGVADRETVPPTVARDLAKAVRDLRGHALALTLAGRFLATAHGGDIRKIDLLPSTAELGRALGALEGYSDDDRDYRDTFKVMHAIEIAAKRMIDEQKATHDPASTAAGVELAILFFLGLFDRPADAKLFDVVYPAAGALEPDPADLQRGATPLVEDPQPVSPAERRERAGLWGAMQAIGSRIFGAAAPEDGAGSAGPALTEQEVDAVREARRRVLLRRLFAGIVQTSQQERANALGRLARRGLVSKARSSDSWEKTAIDCHPLVREYFGLRLKRLDPEAYRAAHGRLYDHLRLEGLPEAFREPVAYGVLALKVAYERDHYPMLRSGFLDGSLNTVLREQCPPSIARLAPDELRREFDRVDGPEFYPARAAMFPETAKHMEPLFSAIRHGCEAQRDEECYREVYWPRVMRGSAYYAYHKLGLFGPVLASLASFFDRPFSMPSARLVDLSRATVLSDASAALRALGRLQDAVEPYKAVTREFEVLEDYNNAGTSAENLSELLLVLGLVSEARVAGNQALEHAARLNRLDRRQIQRRDALSVIVSAAVADGDAPAAEIAQISAEVIQSERQPRVPRLYSRPGFVTALLLHHRGRTAEIEDRYNWLLGVRTSDDSLLDEAFEELAAAKARLVRSAGSLDQGALEVMDNTSEGVADNSLATLRRTAADHLVPHGLLIAAEARWRAGRNEAAEELLRECSDRVERGPMPLFHAELLLLRARIALTTGIRADAVGFYDCAAELIVRHGYGGAAPELAVLRAEIEPTDAHIAAAAQAIRGDAAIPQDEEHGFGDGWWGLLPRFRALVEKRPDFAERLAELEAAADGYNAARDAWLERTGGVPKPGELGRQSAAKPSNVTPDQITDDMVEAALADEGMRETLSGALSKLGVTQPLEEAPREVVKAALAAIVTVAQQRQERENPRIPDELVAQVFADPRADGPVRDVMRQNDLQGEPQDLPDHVKRQIVEALVEGGVIKFGEQEAS